MPEYLSPGVFVEEVATGPRPIEGVSTSTAGFVGQTERGPVLPRLITSSSEFQRWYGGVIDQSFLPFAAQGFFDNGGKRLFVARVIRSDAALATLTVGSLLLSALGKGAWGNRVFVKVADSRSGSTTLRFRLTIAYYRTPPPTPLVDPTDPTKLKEANRREPDLLEDFDNLGFDPAGPNYVLTRLNGSSQLVKADWAAAPARPGNAAFKEMAGGSDGTAAITDKDYLGDPTAAIGQRTGLAGLEEIDEISLLCVPDEVHPALGVPVRNAIRTATVGQCERLKDRFAILQVEQGQGNVATILPPVDTTYAAIYYPWIRVFDPRSQDFVLVPPGGHVTGIYARTDVERGVHKAPANEVVRGILTRDLNGICDSGKRPSGSGSDPDGSGGSPDGSGRRPDGSGNSTCNSGLHPSVSGNSICDSGRGPSSSGIRSFQSSRPGSWPPWRGGWRAPGRRRRDSRSGPGRARWPGSAAGPRGSRPVRR